MRRTVPLAIALIAGTILLAQYFVPALYDAYEMALVWLPVIVGVTAYLGIISFVRHHWIKTKRRTPDWRFSVAALLAFVLMVFAGFWGSFFGASIPDVPPTWPKVAIQDVPDDAGGQVNLEWKLDGTIGKIRKFEVRRKKASESDDAYVAIREFDAKDDSIGTPHTNRDNRGEPYPSILENGGFERDFTGWTPDGDVALERDDYMGRYAVLTDGGALAGPVTRGRAGRRYSLSVIARRLDGAPKLTVRLLRGTEELAARESPLEGDEWIEVPPVSAYLESDADLTVRFEVKAGKAALDKVELRPVDIEYWCSFTDASPFNYDEDFPRYGEGDNILTGNRNFELSLEGWEAGPGVERVERKDREKGFCARIPAGSSLLSAPMKRSSDPMGQRLRYRFRGWGRGGKSPLTVEILAYDEDGKPIDAKAVTFAADSDWEQKEITMLPPETTSTLRLRYRATGSEGYAFADDMVLMPVKVDPAPGVLYAYRVEARDAAGTVLATRSATLSGDMEPIGTSRSRVGLYQWLFQYLLVPMEATMFALLAFYIASAAFRAFRARSLEATLLLVAAILVMIGRVPLGDQIWTPLGKIADWIMTYPNGASKRAIMIGVGLGMAATSLKLMLGIERAYLGRGQ